MLGVPEVLPLVISAPTAPLSEGNAEGTFPTPGWLLRKGRDGTQCLLPTPLGSPGGSLRLGLS